MKWFSHLAAMTFGIGFIEIVHELGLSQFANSRWLEGVFWLMMSTVLLLGYLYEKRRSGASRPESA